MPNLNRNAWERRFTSQLLLLDGASRGPSAEALRLHMWDAAQLLDPEDAAQMFAGLLRDMELQEPTPETLRNAAIIVRSPMQSHHQT